MLYLYSEKNDVGAYSSPQSTPAKGLLNFPEELLDKLIECQGFVSLTVTDGTVTAIKKNTKALEAWTAKQQGAE